MKPKLFLPLTLALALWHLPAFAEESATSHTSATSPAAAPETTDLTSLVSVAASDLSFAGDTVSVLYNGAQMPFEVSTSEYYTKDKLTGETTIESLVESKASAEEMRRFVLDEDAVWGQDCKLVLYKAGEPQTDENRSLLTHKIEIRLDDEVASMQLLNQLADAVGVEVGSTDLNLDFPVAWLRASCGGSALKAAQILSAHEGVVRARPILTIPMVKNSSPPGGFYTPNDPFYTPTDQYYLHHEYAGGDRIDVWQVWCGGGDGFPELQQQYFGRGVDVNLLDDGVQGDHPDLDNAFVNRKSEDFVNGTTKGYPGTFQDNHGTQMAGIISAEHNGIGIAGIAPACDFYSTRVFGADSDPQIIADAHEHERNSVQVIATGFGPTGNYVDITEILEEAFLQMADRKNVPICYPAGGGSGGDRVDYDRLASHRHTIATGAMGADSEPGCSLITIAPGVDMGTTDRTGEEGESADDYVFDFEGTSAANACTAGVVALMKDARPDLGWRDYQEILLLTSAGILPANGAGVDTPLGFFPFKFGYQEGGGIIYGIWAVALAEVWSRLPDSATLYKVSNQTEFIREEIGATAELQPDGTYEISNPIQTFLFDFNKEPGSKKNLRIEHIEVCVEWEEIPIGDGAAPTQLPTYLLLVDPYWLAARPTATSANASLLSSEEGEIESPVKWTYTTVRHWGLVNTGGFDRTGVPGTRPGKITPAGVWELDVGVTAFIAVDPIDESLQPFDPSSRLTRTLNEVTITMYGTENNLPPTIVSAGISTSGNPGVLSPRTAFEDEDLLVDDLVIFDPEGDQVDIQFSWEELGEDGLTWSAIGPSEFTPSDCEFDEYIKIEVNPSVDGNLYDRYFTLNEPGGDSVLFYFENPDTGAIPGAAAGATRAVAITGVAEDEGAMGVAEDIRAAIDSDPAFTGVTGVPYLMDDEVGALFPQMTGNVPEAEPNNSNLTITIEASQDETGNCFPVASGRLDASVTSAERVYRAVITPRDGLREGFRFITDQIIVNSRPVTTGSHDTPYFYDANVWILTVPPEGLSPFAFINEVSQGTGDTTTNREWVEIMVNFTADFRGARLRNDIAGFDLTFTDHPVWEEVQYGTIIVIYNDGQRDPIIPPDTPIGDFATTTEWIISSGNSDLFTLPGNGDGWGEFSNIDCTAAGANCDGANVALHTRFDARAALHGVSFNGNSEYVDAGLAPAVTSLFFDGTALVSGGDPSPTDSAGWVVSPATAATPGAVNSANNQALLDLINLEMKTSVPTYRFYPGDGTQEELDPVTFQRLGTPDLVASDLVPGLVIDRKTGVVSGTPDVPGGGTFTIKIQRFHSFSSEIQIYELEILPGPPLVDSEDEEGDGLINLLEEALGTDPYAAEANVLPFGEVVTSGGMEYMAITYRRLKGGVVDGGTYTIGDLVYSIEASSDLLTWKTAPDIFVMEESVVDSVDKPATVEVATFRVLDAFGSVGVMGRYYLRLRVTRLP